MSNFTKKIQALSAKAGLVTFASIVSTTAFAGMGTQPPVISVTEPGTLALIGAGVAAAFIIKKRKK